MVISVVVWLFVLTWTTTTADAASLFGDGEFIRRRWESLLTNCLGNWSGSIGWYDLEWSDEKADFQLTSRPDSFTRNMRMSFHLREDNNTVGDWIVYHARGQGVRDEVVLEKLPSSKAPPQLEQTLYVFPNGNLGRTGRSLLGLPVVEHGFWDVVSQQLSTRRTIVVVYSRTRLVLEKICFLQQEKQWQQQFDVSQSNSQHIKKQGMTPRDSMALETRQAYAEQWNLKELKLRKAEYLNASGRRRWWRRFTTVFSCILPKLSRKSLDYLLGLSTEDQDPILRLVLPNGVLLACPLRLETSTTTGPTLRISMGYQRENGEIQVLELFYDGKKKNLPLKFCRAFEFSDK